MMVSKLATIINFIITPPKYHINHPKWMISDPKSLPKIGRSIDTATCSAQVNESVDCLERSSTGLSSPPNSVATELRSFVSNI
jgi:hypothetical protein